MHDPLIGRQLANYRLDREIGRGGMAVVYAGWDLKLDRPVAVKVINTLYQDTPGYAQRFVQEARAVARWRHENIIHIYYSDDESGLYYFVMEYIEGVDLRRRLAEYAAAYQLIPQNEVIRIGRAIANALDFAHGRGIVHRDVKPANVMLGHDGRVVLMDFGLALHVDRGSFGEILGSPAYISPEQARSSALAVPASDLYGLAVILYEMLTGTLPFDDPSPATLAVQHMTQPLPSPRLRNPLLNEMTEAVLVKALAKESTERYPNGKALMDTLAAALQATPGRDELIGQQLDEYRIVDYLGRGGMARVYRGIDITLGRPVAIKLIDTPYHTDDDYQARFKQEARAVAQLEHPNIVRLYRYRETEGLLYMAIQFIEGETLANFLNRNKPLSLERAVPLVRDICSALDYAHGKGVIHRDIKPANVMVDAEGRAIVMDFGLALLIDLGSRGEIFGSPDYISPEQAISSAQVVPQSDLYAVGVILYEMLTGELPFIASDPLDVAMMHLSEPPRLPRLVNPALSPATEVILLKALAKETHQRYQKGADLVQALTQTLQESAAAPVISPTPGPDEPIPVTSQPIEPYLLSADPPEHFPNEAFPPVERPLPPLPPGVIIQSPPVVAEVKTETMKPPPAIENRQPVPPPRPRRRGRRFWLYLFSTILIAAAILVASAYLWPENGLTPTPIAVNPTATPTTNPTSHPTNTPLPTPEITFTLEIVHTATVVPSPLVATPVPPTSTTTPTPSATPPPTPSRTPTPTPIVILTRQEDGMPMVLVPGGSFVMGASATDVEADPDEQPTHEVILDSFYLDQYEINVAQYAAFLNANDGYVQACAGFTCAWTLFESSFTYLMQNADGSFVAQTGFADYPVNYVSWYGAAAYCDWVLARLPTEAEWEYTARGLEGYRYPWGNEQPSNTLALFGRTDFQAIQPVTSYPDGVTPLHVYGLAGSMWEWTSDWYDAAYYTTSPTLNPTGSATVTTAGRVLRGGGWRDEPLALRATNRQAMRPATFERDIGFRCGRSVGE